MDGGADRKRAVMTGISYAIDKEAAGDDQEAFQRYLQSVQNICALLAAGVASGADVAQMIALARQCLDRVQHMADALGGNAAIARTAPLEEEEALQGREQRLPGPLGNGGLDAESAWSTYRAASLCEPSAPALCSDTESDSVEDNCSAAPGLYGEAVDSDECHSIEDNAQVLASGAEAGLDAPSQRDPSSAENGELDGGYFAADIVHQRVPITSPVDELDPAEEQSPLEAARRENERLLATYPARIQRSPLHVQHNLRLELQRRLTENRQIAVMKQQAWLKRRDEARQHHVQIAKRVFSVAEGSVATPEDLQKQTAFADILQFEQTRAWTKQLHHSLDEAPDDPRAVENALLHMFLEKSHPLSKLRQRLQYSLFCKINPLVEQHAHLLETVQVPLRGAAAGRRADPDSRQQADAARQVRETPGPGKEAAGDGDAARRVPKGHPEEAPERASRASELPGGGEEAASGRTEADTLLWPSLPALDDSDECPQQTEAFRRHLWNVVSETQEGVRLLVALAAAVHPALAPPLSRPVVQRLLFTPLWPHLLVLLRLAHLPQERRCCAARPTGRMLSEMHFISEFTADGELQGDQSYCLTSLQTVLLYLSEQ
ncbi:VPS9 domain-containing protein 1-like [Pollicipes pollicipes]|uniref:VPS9 domain-containing protein 1-like n=1 Tax=Pollicipes pollicipes TaxID=41117 RepID=UPI001885807F|nr:VPS9 domain-containing protein 1-like [Pollicipes pollicipes]